MFVGRKEFEVRKIDRSERISDSNCSAGLNSQVKGGPDTLVILPN